MTAFCAAAYAHTGNIGREVYIKNSCGIERFFVIIKKKVWIK